MSLLKATVCSSLQYERVRGGGGKQWGKKEQGLGLAELNSHTRRNLSM